MTRGHSNVFQKVLVRQCHLAICIAVFVMAQGRNTYLRAADTSKPQSESFTDFSTEVTATISGRDGDTYKAFADLGKLPAGKNGTVRIRLENPNPFDIPIASLIASCGCTKAKLLGDTIPRLGTATLEVRVSPPSRNRSSKFHGTLAMLVDDRRASTPNLGRVVVTLSYEIDGILCFLTTVHPVYVSGDKEVEIVVAFVRTTGTPLRKLRVEASGAIEGVEGALVSSESRIGEVIMRVDPGIATADGSVGKISVFDDVAGVSDSIDLILYKEATFKISPRTMRFRRDGDDYVATGILNVAANASDNAEASDSALNRATFVEAYIGESSLDVGSVRLSDRIYRLHVRLPAAAEDVRRENDELDSQRITWNVVSGSLRQVLHSRFEISGP